MEINTPETILNNITELLEEHTTVLNSHATILKSHRDIFDHLGKEVGDIKRRLEKIEAAGSLNSSDSKFIADTTARLKAISATLDAKA